MLDFQPTRILLHLTTGSKHLFYQDDATVVSKICQDLDGQIFSRASLIIHSSIDATAFPGRFIMGITVLTDRLPEAFLQRERSSQTMVAQINFESFQFRRLQHMSRVEGERSTLLSELEFTSGERLYLEFVDIATNGLGERNALSHLFARPSLACRRLEGGFTVWNTAHIVSWSHYPKLMTPSDAWLAESLIPSPSPDGKSIKML